ncbi:MAG: thiol peroxidase, partial [Acholeplasma sp.]|nr:thiol peroxidase [Acholeplasma sp.]
MRTYKGKIITLVNEQLKTGDIAPDFKLVNSSLEDVYLHDFKESYLIINVVPSLDTPVCDIQTKTINEEIIQNNKINLRVITISNDLPFAQQRWCDHEEMEGIAVYSDYLYHDFGNKFGVLINEVKLLAR